MIGTLIGAGVGLVGSIFGGAAKRREARKQARLLRKQNAENEAWYNKNYYEDATQRADAQRAMQMARDTFKDRNKRAEAAASVTGATDESIAAQKEAANRVLGQTTANIVAGADRRKDAIEAQYQRRKDMIADRRMSLSEQRAMSAGNAAQGMSAVGAGIADGLYGMFDKSAKTA